LKYISFAEQGGPVVHFTYLLEEVMFYLGWLLLTGGGEEFILDGEGFGA